MVVNAVALGGGLNLTLDVDEAGGVGLEACSLLSKACSIALASKSKEAGSVFGDGPPNTKGGAARPGGGTIVVPRPLPAGCDEGTGGW